MSHILELTLSLKVDGISQPNFPLIRRLQVSQMNTIGQVQGDGVGYTSLASALTALQVAVITSDQPISIRANNQTDKSLPLNAGGLICFFDVNIDTSTLLSILNGGTEDANVNILVGGSVA